MDGVFGLLLLFELGFRGILLRFALRFGRRFGLPLLSVRLDPVLLRLSQLLLKLFAFVRFLLLDRLLLGQFGKLFAPLLFVLRGARRCGQARDGAGGLGEGEVLALVGSLVGSLVCPPGWVAAVRPPLPSVVGCVGGSAAGCVGGANR